MDPVQAFIDGFVFRVFRSAVSGTKSLLTNPPGRSPAPALVALSQWYTRLSDNDRAQVDAIIAMASDLATFNAAAVLDGSARVLPQGSELRVQIVSTGEVLTITDNIGLHDRYREVIGPLGRDS